jgi:hypothetical protein
MGAVLAASARLELSKTGNYKPLFSDAIISGLLSDITYSAEIP